MQNILNAYLLYLIAIMEEHIPNLLMKVYVRKCINNELKVHYTYSQRLVSTATLSEFPHLCKGYILEFCCQGLLNKKWGLKNFQSSMDIIDSIESIKALVDSKNM